MSKHILETSFLINSIFIPILPIFALRPLLQELSRVDFLNRAFGLSTLRLLLILYGKNGSSQRAKICRYLMARGIQISEVHQLMLHFLHQLLRTSFKNLLLRLKISLMRYRQQFLVSGEVLQRFLMEVLPRPISRNNNRLKLTAYKPLISANLQKNQSARYRLEVYSPYKMRIEL